jgi:hypothetical protein
MLTGAYQVAGEIQNHETLRKGFIRAVWVVGVLYMLINIVYVSKRHSNLADMS